MPESRAIVSKHSELHRLLGPRAFDVTITERDEVWLHVGQGRASVHRFVFLLLPAFTIVVPCGSNSGTRRPNFAGMLVPCNWVLFLPYQTSDMWFFDFTSNASTDFLLGCLPSPYVKVMAKNLMTLEGRHTTVAVLGSAHLDGMESILSANGWVKAVSKTRLDIERLDRP